MALLITDNYDEMTLVGFLNFRYFDKWVGRFDVGLGVNVVDIPTVLQADLDIAVGLYDFASNGATVTDDKRIADITQKAIDAITTLACEHVRIDLVARGLIELATVLIQKGVIDVADLPPKAVELATLWADNIDIINAARDLAISDGTLADDFNP